MSLVILASGGVDSTLMSVLATHRGVEVHPVFVNYGQLAVDAEWRACQNVYRELQLPRPRRVNLSGYGKAIPSGLTRSEMRIREDAFLPTRNLFLLTVATGIACSVNAGGVAIGLLREADSIFPDQTSRFLALAQDTLSFACGRHIQIVAPLMEMSKGDVLALAAELGISGTYSCHAGTARPCGKCVSCREAIAARAERTN